MAKKKRKPQASKKQLKAGLEKGGGKKQGKKGGGKKGKKGGGGSKTIKKISQDILDPLKNLTGTDLRKVAEALTRAGSGRELTALDAMIASLQRNRDVDVGKLQRLGEQATGNVSSYYRSLAQAESQNLARQQALGQRLQQDVGAAGTAAQQNIQQAGAAANAQLNQPSSARNELQAMIAAQTGRASREQQA
jgi:hypothetical protein